MNLSATSTAANVSTANNVYDAIISLEEQEQPSGLSMASLTERYARLQVEHDPLAEVSARIVELFPQLTERFADTSSKAQVALGSSGDYAEEQAAMAMRTFLHKLKGHLMQLVRRTARENMPWILIAERLCADDAAEILREQEAAHDGLQTGLSNIGKARASAFSFKDTWVKFVDDVYVVCGAVLAGRER